MIFIIAAVLGIVGGSLFALWQDIKDEWEEWDEQ